MAMNATDALLLPGLLCDGAIWAGQIERFTSLHCHVPDYGEADSIGAMAELALRQAPSRFVLAGHSMGGRVALEIYRRAPERVSHLILLDTGFQARPAGEAGEGERQARMALLKQARDHGMRTMGEAWMQGMVHPDRLTNTALTESILQMIERKTPTIFAAQIQALLERPDATPVLSDIRCPTLLVCGRQDTWSPLSRHEEMARSIEGSRLAVIEEAGHMSPMERPEAVASTIHDWLETATPVLSDRQRAHIERTCTRLVLDAADRTDRQDYPGLAELFHENGRLYRPTAPQQPLEGREAILAAYRQRPGSRVTRHFCSNIRVTVESAGYARVHCYVQVFAANTEQPADGPFGLPLDGRVMIGEFDDVCVADNGEWRFAERRARFVMHRGD